MKQMKNIFKKLINYFRIKKLFFRNIKLFMMIKNLAKKDLIDGKMKKIQLQDVNH